MNHITSNNISRYLRQRIKHHHDMMASGNYFNTGYQSHDIHETIFYLFYFILSEYLAQGNTVLILNQKDWQRVVLEFMTNYINECLSYSVDFREIFYQIDELSQDKKKLKQFIDEKIISIQHINKKQELYEKLKNNNNEVENSNFAINMADIFLWTLRFYYYAKYVLCGDLSVFIKKLFDNDFFEHHQQKCTKPLIFNGDDGILYIWLNRIYHAERHLLSSIHEIDDFLVQEMMIDDMDDRLNVEQQQAVNQAINQPISIITGGPGTGKTFTIAQIVIALYTHNHHHHLALVAPTGKAAQRMKESLQQSLNNDNIHLPEPMTIHRLLGMGNGNTPRYHQNNPLSFDMIIVDEASMIGVELASYLLSAIKKGSRLILLGDTQQLSAVEAGSVLSDLCRLPKLSSSRTHLIQSRRFHDDSGIGKLAMLVNRQEVQSYQTVISAIDEESKLSFIDISTIDKNPHHVYEQLTQGYHHHKQKETYFSLSKYLKNKFHQMNEQQKKEQLNKLFMLFNQYRILTASHLSLCGDRAINNHIQNVHRQYLGLPVSLSYYSSWYHGRPVMILKNRYDLGLFNGDIGICLQDGKKGNQLSVYFYGDTIKSFAVSLLEGDISTTAYAMTVHKSQGSEFDKVAVVFYDKNQRLLSKELIYTAITRAKEGVQLYSTPTALLSAINKPTVRQTGLTLHPVLQDGAIDNKI